MRTNEVFLKKELLTVYTSKIGLKRFISIISVFILIIAFPNPVTAHCDSYDGPTVKDAEKALETNNVNLVIKWITAGQEKEIIPLFNKTYSLKSGDKEVYEIVKKHFLETLVRLHRETEGAPFTGLKPAGTTKQIILLSDQAIENKNVDDLLKKLNGHMGLVIKEKYDKVISLNKIKNDSPENGREYVVAYVDYTHTLEAIHDILDHEGEHNSHKH